LQRPNFQSQLWFHDDFPESADVSNSRRIPMSVPGIKRRWA